MAVEDGAVLGRLLGLLRASERNTKACPSNIPDLLKLFESLRKARTTVIVQGAVANQKWFHLPDGPLQRQRDASLVTGRWDAGREVEWNLLNDRYQAEMLSFDAVRDCERAFHEWRLQKHKM